MMLKISTWMALGMLPVNAFAGVNSSSHGDPVASVILGVTSIFFFAVIGRYAARCLNQPGVLGELLIGVLLGNLCYFFNMELAVILREGPAVFTIMRDMLAGMTLHEATYEAISNPNYAAEVFNALSSPNGIDYFKISYVADIFSRYGVIFLLFMVGLDSSIEKLKNTGRESIQVALIGVLAPIILGLIAAYFFMQQASFKSSLFIAATLCATSIGISARVLSDLHKLNTREAQTILGAAMLDDVLGLIILAIVSSIVISGVVDMMMIGHIFMLSAVFFVFALFAGPFVLRKAIDFFRFLDLWEAKLFISFVFVMLLAWLASIVQLASIVGAFTAGLILHDDYFNKSYWHHHHHSLYSIKNLMSPLESVLAPLFFMLIGLQVKLETFFHMQVLLMAIALLVAAVVGKLLSGFGAKSTDDRLLIGIGMLPRGEVGLVFASIGRGLNVINDDLFSAIILMVIVTTLIAPPLMKRRYQHASKEVSR